MALTNQERDWALCEIEYMKDRFDFMDNYRVAEVGDDQEEGEFGQLAYSGCCGSYEDVVEYNGKKIRIGFNYGH